MGMQNHNNLYRTMIFGMSLLAGGQLGYTIVSADATTSSQTITSEISSEQSSQASLTTNSVSTSSITSSSSVISSSVADSTDVPETSSNRTTTASSAVNHRSGYVYAPDVSSANGGWNWLEHGQPYTGFRKYQGSYYWFQQGVRQNNQWETAWGHQYYVGADGRAV